ncbi:MAG: hypothetical protein KF768_08280 [Phycisphaeraceae bacterium]|nr:hypothetical protein [Phycisphaeraceae bacterium]
MPVRTLYLDLNSYFASCEQQDRPELRGRPVAVVPVEAETTFVIAASVEAKRFGIKTGTRVSDARRMCPPSCDAPKGLITVHARPERYVELHHAIFTAVETVLPIERVWSIDEFECKLLGSQQEPDEATRLALACKRAIRTCVGERLTCSIGLAPNRVLGKLASDMQKPDGLVLLRPEDLPGAIERLGVRELAGIGPNMEARLHKFGVRTIGDLLARSERDLRSAWGSVIGAEWYHWLRGRVVSEHAVVTRSIGHEHVLAPDLRTSERARGVLIRLLHKAATRARQKGFVAGEISVAVRGFAPGETTGGWGLSARREAPKAMARALLSVPTADTLQLVRIVSGLFDDAIAGLEGIPPIKVAVTLGALEPIYSASGSLFDQRPIDSPLGKAMDRINGKFGRHTVYPASMHAAKSSAPMRIAFGSIPDPELPA